MGQNDHEITWLKQVYLSISSMVLRHLADDEWDFYYQTKMDCSDSAKS